MPPPKLSPNWIKAQKGLTDSMKVLAERVKALDTHFVGMVLARQAQKVQDGPFRKALIDLRTDSKMVRNALQANKTDKNEDEVEDFIYQIDRMFSEDLKGDHFEVWYTHTKGLSMDKDRVDKKKTNLYLVKALKKWTQGEKKVKNKMVKKILSKSKTPAFLVALSKKLTGVAAAKDAFHGHLVKFNQSYGLLEKGLDDVAKELPKVVATLKKTRAEANKLNKISL